MPAAGAASRVTTRPGTCGWSTRTARPRHGSATASTCRLQPLPGIRPPSCGSSAEIRRAARTPDDFVEVVSRRYGVLGPLTPVLSTGAVVANGKRHELHGALRGLAARASIAPSEYSFSIRGPVLRIDGQVHCNLADLVGVSYRDPDGGRVYAYAADHAVIEVEVRRRGVRGWTRAARLSAGVCAYEYATRKPVPG